MSNLRGKVKYVLAIFILIAFSFSLEHSKEDRLVVIKNTASTADVLHDLQERGYLNSNLSFWVALFLNAGDSIEPGVYSLRKRMGALALSAELNDPDYKYVYVQEGLRKEEVAEVFAKALDWNDEQKASFLWTLPMCSLTDGEGFLFPGNYLVKKDESPEVIREEMHERLLGKVAELLDNPEENVLNISQVITIASLIQREAGSKRDMGIISGIILNRIYAEIPLQIDATLQYVKGDEKLWWPTVNSKDKYLESPYNTYLEKGLPPGPIASPGIAAIEAALNPVDTDCIFYIHDKNRNMHCSTTYDGHKRNISYYLK